MVDFITQSSGIANVIMNYYRHISKKNVRIDFMVSKIDDNLRREIELNSSKIYIMPHLADHKLFDFICFQHSFFKKHGEEYTVVHSHTNILDAIVYLIARKCGVRIYISHSHSSIFSHKKLAALRNMLMCLPIRFMKVHKFACSKNAAAHLFGKNIDYKKVYFMHNAVDTTLFCFNEKTRDDLRERMGFADKKVLGHIGRFDAIKNQRFLIDILHELLKFDSSYRMILIGVGKQFEDIKRYAKEKRVYDEIVFTGSRTDINAYMSVMDIFVMPSLSEGLPVTAIEAQAEGLPCILSDNITEEVKLLDSVKYVPLAAGAYHWAVFINEILLKPIERECASQLITKSGYNIVVEAKKLENYYASL